MSFHYRKGQVSEFLIYYIYLQTAVVPLSAQSNEEKLNK